MVRRAQDPGARLGGLAQVAIEQAGQGGDADTGGRAAEEMAARQQQARGLVGVHNKLSVQFLVTVSSRLSSTLATMLYAASSSGGSDASRSDSPTPSSFSAA